MNAANTDLQLFIQDFPRRIQLVQKEIFFDYQCGKWMYRCEQGAVRHFGKHPCFDAMPQNDPLLPGGLAGAKFEWSANSPETQSTQKRALIRKLNRH